MSSELTCTTIYNRITRCTYYSEINTYAKIARRLFNTVLNEFAKNRSQNLASIFSDIFSRKTYSGKSFIYSNDRDEFRQFCINCYTHLDELFNTYDITNLMDTYTYKSKIKGYIGGIIPEKTYNIWFSFKNWKETYKELDFASFNNYIYNQTKSLNNDCLVMSVPDNSFILAEYNDSDYTIKRGFLTTAIKSRFRKPGIYCNQCSNKCKPTFISSLDRLRTVL